MSDLLMLLIGVLVLVGILLVVALRPAWFGAFLASPWGSALRVFGGLVMGSLVLDFLADKRVSVTLDELSTWIAAAAAVAVPIIIAAVNPADPRFGKKG